MNLTLIPQFGADGDSEITLHVAGDVITIDGSPYDLGAVPAGGEGWSEGESPFMAPVPRQDGVLHVTIIARLGHDAAPDQDGPWMIEGAAGAVVIPAQRMEDIEGVAD